MITGNEGGEGKMEIKKYSISSWSYQSHPLQVVSFGRGGEITRQVLISQTVVAFKRSAFIHVEEREGKKTRC